MSASTHYSVLEQRVSVTSNNQDLVIERDENSAPDIPVTTVYPVLSASVVYGNDEDIPEAIVLENESVLTMQANVQANNIHQRQASFKYCDFLFRWVLQGKVKAIFICLTVSILIVAGFSLYSRGPLGGKSTKSEISSLKWRYSLSTLNGTHAREHFGAGLAMSHDGKIVASVGRDGKLVFEEKKTGWVQKGQTICFCNDVFGDLFDHTHERDHEIGYGVSLSVNGTRLLVSVSFVDFGGGLVEDWNAETESWENNIIFIGENSTEGFGSASDISHDGSRIAFVSIVSKVISIYDEDPNNSSNWNKHLYLLGTDDKLRSSRSRFLALSGNGKRIAVGGVTGVKIIEEKQPGKWEQIGQRLFGESIFDQFGASLNLNFDGSRIIIGAPSISYGYVKVLDYLPSENKWIQIGNRLGGQLSGDRFGFSVSISSDGSRIAIGAFGGGPFPESGSVFLFHFMSDNWVQIGQKIEGDTTGDWFGYDVKISADGNRAGVSAILAPQNGLVNSGYIKFYDIESIHD